MQYKDLFRKWWFYALMVVIWAFNVFLLGLPNGIGGLLGSFIGSFLNIFMLSFIFLTIAKGIQKLKNLFTRKKK